MVPLCSVSHLHPETMLSAHSWLIQVPGTYLCQSCINDQPQSTDWKVISCLSWDEGRLTCMRSQLNYHERQTLLTCHLAPPPQVWMKWKQRKGG